MTRSTIFVDETRREIIRRWHETFRAKTPSATPTEVSTSFGKAHALIAGPPDAPPLVVLHGALASSAHLLPELAPLLATRRIIALDVVGQSVMSEDRRVSLDGDDYGRWVAEATAALGLDRFDLLGVSWGGFVATRAAQTLGDRLGRLVLLVPAGFVSGPAWAGFREVGWPMMTYRMFPTEKRLLRVMRGLFSTIDDDWKAYFGEALRAYRFDMRIPPLAKPGDLAGVTCPVLVVGAELDVSFPGEALLARAKELLPHAETELLEGAKHSPPQTASFRERLSARIERFLRGSSRG